MNYKKNVLVYSCSDQDFLNSWVGKFRKYIDFMGMKEIMFQSIRKINLAEILFFQIASKNLIFQHNWVYIIISFSKEIQHNFRLS